MIIDSTIHKTPLSRIEPEVINVYIIDTCS